jgi:D-sedoheptulose 7-phosphate isomerase
MSPANRYFGRLVSVVNQMDLVEIDRAVGLVEAAWKQGKQIIILGNGGSAMTAIHFATDWSKGIFQATGRPFRARTLLDNMGLITAYANDVSYHDVFSEQIKNVAEREDLVIAISGSGNSENVVRAIDLANTMGCVTLGLCGYSGGRLKTSAQHALWVNVDDMQISEDLHAIFGHIVMQSLCGMLIDLPDLALTHARVHAAR